MKKLTPAALGFAARSLCAIRGYEAPSGPVLDSARLEIERLVQAAEAWDLGEAFDRYNGQRATLTRDVRLGDPGAFLVAGAEVRVVGVVDDETLTVEPADLPGDSVAVSLYDLAFEPEAPAPDLADADSPAAKYFPDLTLAPAPRAADGSFGLPGSPPEAAQAPQGRETAPTLDLGDATPETPRHGPQTSAQAMPATEPDLVRGYGWRLARTLTVQEVDGLAEVFRQYANARDDAFGADLGATDADLSDLFPTIDRHARKLVERINAAEPCPVAITPEEV